MRGGKQIIKLIVALPPTSVIKMIVFTMQARFLTLLFFIEFMETSAQLWNNAETGVMVRTLYLPLYKGSPTAPFPAFKKTRPLSYLNAYYQQTSVPNVNYQQNVKIYEQDNLHQQGARFNVENELQKDNNVHGQASSIASSPQSNFQYPSNNAGQRTTGISLNLSGESSQQAHQQTLATNEMNMKTLINMHYRNNSPILTQRNFMNPNYVSHPGQSSLGYGNEDRQANSSEQGPANIHQDQRVQSLPNNSGYNPSNYPPKLSQQQYFIQKTPPQPYENQNNAQEQQPVNPSQMSQQQQQFIQQTTPPFYENRHNGQEQQSINPTQVSQLIQQTTPVYENRQTAQDQQPISSTQLSQQQHFIQQTEPPGYENRYNIQEQQHINSYAQVSDLSPQQPTQQPYSHHPNQLIAQSQIPYQHQVKYESRIPATQQNFGASAWHHNAQQNTQSPQQVLLMNHQTIPSQQTEQISRNYAQQQQRGTGQSYSSQNSPQVQPAEQNTKSNFRQSSIYSASQKPSEASVSAYSGNIKSDYTSTPPNPESRSAPMLSQTPFNDIQASGMDNKYARQVMNHGQLQVSQHENTGGQHFNVHPPLSSQALDQRDGPKITYPDPVHETFYPENKQIYLSPPPEYNLVASSLQSMQQRTPNAIKPAQYNANPYGDVYSPGQQNEQLGTQASASQRNFAFQGVNIKPIYGYNYE